MLLFSAQPGDLACLRQAFEQEGFAVDPSSDCDRLLQLARRSDHDIILLSFDIVAWRAVELCRELARIKSFASCPAVVLAGLHNDLIANELRKLGISQYLKKPVSRITLSRTVQSALETMSYFDSNGQVLKILESRESGNGSPGRA